MKQERISLYEEQIRGVSYKPADLHTNLNSSSMILLRANNINDGKINYDDVVYVDRKKVSDAQILKPGDILICASSGSKNLVGKAAQFFDETECTFGAFCMVVRPKNNIQSKYLGAFFQSNQYRIAISKMALGANINNIRNEHIDSFEIPIPPINVQNEIIKAVDYVQQITDNQKHELELLDQLIKARFVEMFGYPFDKDKWPVKQLKDVSKSMLDGSNVNTDYYEENGDVLFLRIQNVWRNEFRLDDSVFISNDINIQKYYDTSLKNGDLLITKIGRYYTKDSSLGRVSVYRGKDDCANYSNNIMRVRLNEYVNSEFANALLNLDDYQAFIKRTSKGGTDKRALSKSLIGSYPIIIPPLELQNQFATFVEQIDKSKFEIQKSLEKTQELYDSLMQKYFG